MRETLADPTLARLAGRFVWLELDFDKPENQTFLTSHGVAYTPSFFVLNSTDERAAATHMGAMTLADLNQFLEQGERGVKGEVQSPAAAALARGDEMLGRGKLTDAAASYREALRVFEAASPQRPQAVRALTWALMTGKESQACAELAATEAPNMPRQATFGSVILSGIFCVNQGGDAPWAKAAFKTLEPLAAESIGLPVTARDNRFQLYQQLMYAAAVHDDKSTVAKWGARWLGEIESTVPAGDDERSALDIARVDAVSLMGTPDRALPALAASERAMPDNYNASLRFAQMLTEAKHYNDAIAACDRGLAHVTGPLGRSWLLQTKATAFIGKGDKAAARNALESALQAAREIGTMPLRDNNVRRLSQAIADLDKKPESK